MRRLHSLVILSLLSATMRVLSAAQPTQEAQQLFGQLLDPATSHEAASRLRILAKQNVEARQYLVARLPPTIANTSPDPVVWRESVGLVGDLRIAEAIPALVLLLDQTRAGGSTTLTQAMTLGDDPVAKALAQIGEPAIEPVRPFLENTASTPYLRTRAASILFNMNLKQADQVLAQQVQVERDPDLKLYIQKRLESPHSWRGNQLDKSQPNPK